MLSRCFPRRLAWLVVVAGVFCTACGGPAPYSPGAYPPAEYPPANYPPAQGAQPATPNPAAQGLDLPEDILACYDRLWRSGVTFELVDRKEASGVYMPIRVTSPIGGVWFTASGGDPSTAIMDCRLGLQLYAWAGSLRRAGVAAVEHFSIYRKGAVVNGGSKKSGHAFALAIDMGRLRMHNGTRLDVLTHWEERGMGDPPCPRRNDESWSGRLIRGVVCDAVDAGLFNVVLTPHHDAAHQNHVHLELKPHTDWTFVK